MSLPEGYTQLPTYFAPEAFSRMRQNGTEVGYDLEQVNRILGAATLLLNESQPTVTETSAIVYRFGVPGPFQPKPDHNFHRSDVNAPYITQDKLTLPIDEPVKPNISRGEITTHYSSILQIQVGKLDKPLAWWLADTLVFPPVEDHRLVASLGAWKRQANMITHASTRERQNYKVSMAAQYAGAIIMTGRHETSPIKTSTP